MRVILHNRCFGDACFILAYDQGASLPFEGALLPDLFLFLFPFSPHSLHKITGVTSKHEMMEKKTDGGKGVDRSEKEVGWMLPLLYILCDTCYEIPKACKKPVRYSGFSL